jgi:hypothetical protein
MSATFAHDDPRKLFYHIRTFFGMITASGAGRGMIYENKINWRDPNKQAAPLVFVQSKFKSAVLDYQIQVEGELEDMIKRHFRNPEAYQTKYLPFQRRMEMVRALIGETPDDAVLGPRQEPRQSSQRIRALKVSRDRSREEEVSRDHKRDS